VSVLGFLGINTIIDIKTNADAALAAAVGNTIRNAGEELQKLALDAVQTEADKLKKAVHESIDAHKWGADETIKLSNENQQRWFKELTTGLSQDEFNEEIGKRTILWQDPYNEKYNMWLIHLIRLSGATLDLANTVDEAVDKLKSKKYNVIISDKIDLFQILKDSNEYVKIVNAGTDELKRYKSIAEQIGVYALVDKDGLLLRAILKMAPRPRAKRGTQPVNELSPDPPANTGITAESATEAP
jgi:hypothetical protein